MAPPSASSAAPTSTCTATRGRGRGRAPIRSADCYRLTALPDDIVPMLDPLDLQSAVRMLASCRSFGDSVPVPLVDEWGPMTPVMTQVRIMSALLCSPGYDPSRSAGLELAAKHGWVEPLPWLIKHGERWIHETTRQAAQHGHIGGLQWARTQSLPAPWGSTCPVAAQHGQLHLLRWARAQRPRAPWDNEATFSYEENGTCNAAARGGHLELLQWARAQSPPAPWGSTCRFAALHGQLDLLRWARAQSPPAP